MFNIRHFIVRLIVLVIVLCDSMFPHYITYAQSGPENLSGWFDERISPWISLISADDEGHLHVIWNGGTDSDMLEIAARNLIFYTWWNGQNWTQPNDVLAAPTGASITPGSLLSTRYGEIVLVWEASNIIYLSRAFIGTASDARNWQTVIVGTGYNPRLAIDPHTDLWYLTWDDLLNIYISYSTEGWNWTMPVTVWSMGTEVSSPRNESIRISNNGSIHLAWSEHTKRREWNGEAIWYARRGKEEESFEIREVARNVPNHEPTLDSPALAVSNQGYVHLFWNNGVGSLTGRFHQWSKDDGITWSSVNAVFPGLSGQTGPAGMTFDSSGILHLITASPLAGTSPNNHATWQDGFWTPYESLWREIYSERPSLAITDGNRLHVVWNSCRECEDNTRRQWSIMYANFQVDSPLSPSPGFITKSIAGNQLQPVQQATETVELTATAPAIPAGHEIDFDTKRTPNPLNSIIWGIVPSILLVVTVFVLRSRSYLGKK